MNQGARSDCSATSGLVGRPGDHEDAIGPDAPVAIAQRAHDRRGDGQCTGGIGQDHEVVAGSVSLDEGDPGSAHGSSLRAGSFMRAAIDEAVDDAGAVASSQMVRGSRWNHRCWRRANRRVRQHDVLLSPGRFEASVQEVDDLGIAKCPAGRATVPQPSVEQALDLLDEAVVEHPSDAVPDPFVEHVSRQVQPDAGVWNQLRAIRRQLRGERLACDLTDLEGPHDPTAVGGQDVGRGHRVPRSEQGVQRVRARSQRASPPSAPGSPGRFPGIEGRRAGHGRRGPNRRRPRR